jgi:hypothetical protein
MIVRNKGVEYRVEGKAGLLAFLRRELGEYGGHPQDQGRKWLVVPKSISRHKTKAVRVISPGGFSVYK